MFDLVKSGDIESVRIGRLRRIHLDALERFARHLQQDQKSGKKPTMPREKTTRNPDRRSSIYQGADGYWHSRVTVGIKENGKPDRRHVTSKDKQKVINGVDRLERARANGTVVKPGNKQTVAEWLAYWVDNIAAPNVRYKTLQGYQIAIKNHIIPALGEQKMIRVAPENFERLYVKMIRSGLKPATAHQVHRTARAAFREARRRKIIRKIPSK